MHDAPPSLPRPSVELMVIGHLAAALEKEIPGLMDTWLESLEDEAIQRDIIRLRAPREAPEVTEVRRQAICWVDKVRLVTLSHLGRRKRRKA